MLSQTVRKKGLPVMLWFMVFSSIMTGPSVIQAKRAAPVALVPIESKGIRYTSYHESDAKYFSVFVKAEKEADGIVLWKSKLYSISYDRAKETDVQDVHLVSMTLQEGYLDMADEKGRRYLVDIRTGSVKIVHNQISKEDSVVTGHGEEGKAIAIAREALKSSKRFQHWSGKGHRYEVEGAWKCKRSDFSKDKDGDDLWLKNGSDLWKVRFAIPIGPTDQDIEVLVNVKMKKVIWVWERQT